MLYLSLDSSLARVCSERDARGAGFTSAYLVVHLTAMREDESTVWVDTLFVLDA